MDDTNYVRRVMGTKEIAPRFCMAFLVLESKIHCNKEGRKGSNNNIPVLIKASPDKADIS